MVSVGCVSNLQLVLIHSIDHGTLQLGCGEGVDGVAGRMGQV